MREDLGIGVLDWGGEESGGEEEDAEELGEGGEGGHG